MAERFTDTTRRDALLLVGFGVVGGFVGAATLQGIARPNPEHDVSDAQGSDGFDFLIGGWFVQHRKLKRRLMGDADWLVFPGTLYVDPILGGLGNIDNNVIDDPSGSYRASSLRLFNPKLRKWSIYWIDGRNPAIDAPLVGSFVDGVGTFYASDIFEQQAIDVRFTYQSLSSEAARWTQAFSTDHARTWETNWIMDFTRHSLPNHYPGG